MNYLYYLLAFLFAFVCVFMMLLILIQKGRGGGLSSAFGGSGGNTAFGTKTGDLLTWVTAVVFGVFLLLTMGLTWTADAIHARAMGVAGQAPAADDTLGGTSPLDADGDGKVEVIPPTSDDSSLPKPPETPEPGIRPDADGSTGETGGPAGNTAGGTAGGATGGGTGGSGSPQ